MAKVGKLVESKTRLVDKAYRFLEEAKAQKEELDRQIKNAKARLQRRTSESGKFTREVTRLIDKYKKEAKDYLIKAIRKAAGSSDEFYITPYQKALNDVAEDESIYKFIISGSQLTTSIAFSIEFETVAGNTSDYARGVSAYRKQLGVTEGKNPKGKKATLFWFNQVYPTAKQQEAVRKRIALSGREAPFWEMLNFGSPSAMNSDRNDDSYNPIIQSPTNFLDNAETSVRLDINTELTRLKIRWREEIEALRDEIERAEEIRRQRTEEIKTLSASSEARNQRIYSNFGELKKYVDSKKLEEAIRAMDSGDARSRILVSKAKSRRRVYYTVAMAEGSME